MVALGSNMNLFNKIVRVDLEKPLFRIEETKKVVAEIAPGFEPTKKGLNEAQMEYFFSKNPTVLPREDSNLEP